MRLLSGLVAAASAFAQFTLDNQAPNIPYGGIGAISTGGSSRLLYDYQEPSRSQILDYLFASNFGANLQILKIEIGGDGMGGDGSEPSYSHTPDDATYTRGTQSWLLDQATGRNGDLRALVVPLTWPAYLRQGDDSNDTPFADPDAAANYVVQWIIGFQNTHMVTIDFVSVWSNPQSWQTTDAQQVAYIKALYNQLQAAGMGGSIQLVCADQADWSCGDAVLADPELANMVYAIGNIGVTPSANARAANKPLWSTKFTAGTADTAGALQLAVDLVSGFVDAGLQAQLIYNLVSAAYFGSPQWNQGLVRANSPWSGHYYTTPEVWATAHFTQFVDAFDNWVILQPGSGNNKMAGGGSWVCFVNTATLDFTLVLIAANGADGDSTTAGTATFTLANDLANKWGNGATPLNVYYSNFAYDVTVASNAANFTTFQAQPMSVPVANNQFSLPYVRHGLYTVTTLGRGGKGDYGPPPEQSAFPSTYQSLFEQGSDCGDGGQARYWIDVSGSFECVVSPLFGGVLQQMAVGTPIGIYGDVLPHTVLGDETWTDVDVTLLVAFQQATDTALLGVHVTSVNSTGDAVQTWNAAPGIWFSVNATGWNISKSLDFMNPSLAPSPVVATGNWGVPLAGGDVFEARMIIQGDMLMVIFENQMVRFMNTSWARGFTTSGFIALGTTSYGDTTQFLEIIVVAGNDTCSGTPVAGAGVYVEQCEAGQGSMSFNYAPFGDGTSGQMQLKANASLCLTAAVADDKHLYVDACDPSGATTSQLWRVETSITDNGAKGGPITCVANNQVIDIAYSNSAVNSKVALYTFFNTPNQLFTYSQSTGLIYAQQLGVCLGACKAL